MRSITLALLVSLALVGNLYASEKKHDVAKEENICIGAGPQSPRDIDNVAGSNSVLFEKAPATGDMNLCNIHFHRNAEHKSAAYSTFIEDGSNSGWT